MSLKYFDIHSHLNLSPLKEQQEDMAKKLELEEVGTITVGTDLETSREAVRIAELYPHCYATVGLHPHEDGVSFDDESFLELASHSKVVAIGECGLDYFRTEDEAVKDRQKELFKKQIALAISVDKPLMIHARPTKGSMDAYHEVLDILEKEKVKANLHFFVGDIGVAKRALQQGHTMSFDGPITFSTDYDEVIKFLPLESIMAETDAPFAAPAPHRGKTCEPCMVKEIYKKIAEIKGLDEEIVRVQLLENTKNFFTIDF